MSDSTPNSAGNTSRRVGAVPHSTPLIDILLVYLRLFGIKPTREEFLSGLPQTDGDLDIDLAARALKRFGCSAKLLRNDVIREQHFPLCARMKDGTWRIIVARKGDYYHCVDETVPNGLRRLPVDGFNAAFSGVAIQALLDIGELQRRHVGQQAEGHWFWGKFKGQKPLIRDIIMGGFVANLIAVAVSLFAMQVYDRVIPNQAVETLWVLVLGAIMAICMEALIKIARSHLMDVSGKNIELEINRELFEKLQGMKLSSRHTTPGSLIYAVREFGSVREFFTSASIGLVGDLPFVFIFLGIVYLIAGPVVWVMIVAILLIIIPSLLAQKTMSRLAEEMQGGASAANKVLIEVGYGAETVKSARGEGYFQRKWEEIATLNAAKTTQQRRLASVLTFWSTGIQQACIVFSVVVGVYLVFAGSFTVGTIIAVSILSGRILGPATQLSGTLARWQQVRSAMDGLEKILTSEQDRAVDRQYSRRQVFDGQINMRSLVFSYGEDSPRAVQINDAVIAAGSKVALLGSNGSGKSTLLKLISGLYAPSAGKIMLDNLDLAQIDPDDVRRNIGYLSQEVKLFSGTLRDNLLLGVTHHDEATLFEAIAFGGLDRFVKSHPKGLDMQIIDGGDGLSVGQRQSVGLARLFLQDPQIVLLDEPTASLDQGLEQQLISRLEKWLDGRTALIATHRTPILQIVDTALVMGNGAVAMQGPRDEILRKLQAPVELVPKARETDVNEKRLSA